MLTCQSLGRFSYLNPDTAHPPQRGTCPWDSSVCSCCMKEAARTLEGGVRGWTWNFSSLVRWEFRNRHDQTGISCCVSILCFSFLDIKKAQDCRSRHLQWASKEKQRSIQKRGKVWKMWTASALDLTWARCVLPEDGLTCFSCPKVCFPVRTHHCLVLCERSPSANMFAVSLWAL